LRPYKPIHLTSEFSPENRIARKCPYLSRSATTFSKMSDFRAFQRAPYKPIALVSDIAASARAFDASKNVGMGLGH
jgi:hypothetical protein